MVNIFRDWPIFMNLIPSSPACIWDQSHRSPAVGGRHLKVPTPCKRRAPQIHREWVIKVGMGSDTWTAVRALMKCLEGSSGIVVV